MEAQERAVKSAHARLILGMAFLTYLLFGMFTAGVGPVLGELSRQTASSLAVIGGVLTFLFLGALLAQLAAGPLIDRFGQRPVIVASLFVLAGGIMAITEARALPWMFAWALFTGIGQGGVDMGANLVVADAASGTSTSALNLLHFFFGMGAFIGPALIALAIGWTDSGLIVHRGVAGLLAVLALALLAALDGRSPGPRILQELGSPGYRRTSVYRAPLLWLLGALLLVYVGVEFSIGSWIPSYMSLTTAMNAANGAWVTSAYWAALAAGRLAAAAGGSRLSPTRLLSLGVVGSLLGALGVVLSHGVSLPTILFLIWISFSYGTVYPTTVAVAADTFAQDRGKAVGVLVALGNVGGIALPWMAGLLLAGVSPLAYVWLVLLSLVLLAAIVFSGNRILLRRQARQVI
jgi:fucose permease